MKKIPLTSIRKKIIQVEDIINSDYKKRYTVQEVADLVNMDVEVLKTQFQKENGTSIRVYQSEVRIVAGRILLAFTERSIRSIATEVGYRSSSSFSQQFKIMYGMAPGVLRKKLHEEHKASNTSRKRRYLNYN